MTARDDIIAETTRQIRAAEAGDEGALIELAANVAQIFYTKAGQFGFDKRNVTYALAMVMEANDPMPEDET